MTASHAVGRTLIGTAALAGAALLALLRMRLQRRLRALEDELARTHKLRNEERAGRTAAEKRLRQQLAKAAPASHGPPSDGQFCYRPIGRLESCFAERRGTPRQGLLVPEARARLKLHAQVVQPRAALDGLSGFSHVWLIYEFHENTNATKRGAQGEPSQQRQAPQVRAKVHPPGLGGDRIGLFATRTPHRPNPIGLSVARLLRVDGDTLVLGGADLIDGTPILDVKPYLRHDIVDDATVPTWCQHRSDASLIADVRFSAEAAAQLDAAAAARRLRFYSDAASIRRALEQALQLDIRSVHQGRGQAVDDAAGQEYSCRFDALRVCFESHTTHVLVRSCELDATTGTQRA